VNPGADFNVCNKKKYFKSLSLNYAFFVKCLSSYVIKFTIHCNNELYICKLLTNYVLKHILPKEVSAGEYFEPCDSYHISVFMFDLRMINMSSELEYDWYW